MKNNATNNYTGLSHEISIIFEFDEIVLIGKSKDSNFNALPVNVQTALLRVQLQI